MGIIETQVAKGKWYEKKFKFHNNRSMRFYNRIMPQQFRCIRSYFEYKIAVVDVQKVVTKSAQVNNLKKEQNRKIQERPNLLKKQKQISQRKKCRQEESS
jgi:hypothetical protein